MQLFIADPDMFSKFFLDFFDPESMEKLPSKVAHNLPKLFFSTEPAAQTAQQQKSRKYHQKPLNAGLGI